MAGVDPAVHVGAPTPILPQGVATFAKQHGGSGGTYAVKKTSVSRDKQKQQPIVFKKAGVKMAGKEKIKVICRYKMSS